MPGIRRVDFMREGLLNFSSKKAEKNEGVQDTEK
jgi:hypothetical protein